MNVSSNDMPAGQKVPCPMDPFVIKADDCRSVDYQSLKLQESPDDVPVGELPRHIQLYCDRFVAILVIFTKKFSTLSLVLNINEIKIT